MGSVALQLFFLVAMVVVAIALVARWGTATRVGLLARLLVAVPASLVIFIVPLAAFGCRCGAGNNPVRQAAIAGVAAMFCALFVRPFKMRAAIFGLFLVAALGASWHFQAQVLPSNQSSCRFTGDPDFVANSCNRPVRVERAWYSTVTGLHPLVDN